MKEIFVPKKRLSEPSTQPFEALVQGKKVQGFIVHKKGKFYAYRNICQHLPISLDLNDNQFFSHDKKYLQCHLHGALYEIETGYCVEGPCRGASLEALAVSDRGEHLVVEIP